MLGPLLSRLFCNVAQYGMRLGSLPIARRFRTGGPAVRLRCGGLNWRAPWATSRNPCSKPARLEHTHIREAGPGVFRARPLPVRPNAAGPRLVSDSAQVLERLEGDGEV